MSGVRNEQTSHCRQKRCDPAIDPQHNCVDMPEVTIDSPLFISIKLIIFCTLNQVDRLPKKHNSEQTGAERFLKAQKVFGFIPPSSSHCCHQSWSLKVRGNMANLGIGFWCCKLFLFQRFLNLYSSQQTLFCISVCLPWRRPVKISRPQEQNHTDERKRYGGRSKRKNGSKLKGESKLWQHLLPLHPGHHFHGSDVQHQHPHHLHRHDHYHLCHLNQITFIDACQCHGCLGSVCACVADRPSL